MYIWRTSKLSEEIKDGQISDNEWKKYILTWLVIFTLSLYMMTFIPYNNLTVMLFELIGTIGVLIFGISITFKTNKNNGSTFISRFIALSVPLTFRIGALSLLIGVLAGALEENILTTNSVDWLLAFSAIVIQIIYFWRVNAHLQYINT